MLLYTLPTLITISDETESEMPFNGTVEKEKKKTWVLMQKGGVQLLVSFFQVLTATRTDTSRLIKKYLEHPTKMTFTSSRFGVKYVLISHTPNLCPAVMRSTFFIYFTKL
jgi:hypothetical protein